MGSRWRWLRYFACAIALVVITAGSVAAVMLRPEALRARLLDALAKAGLPPARVSGVRLTSTGGVDIENLEFFQPGESAPIARVGAATLSGGGLALLRGDLQSSTLYVRDAELNVLAPPGPDSEYFGRAPTPNWSTLPWRFPDWSCRRLPHIRFDNIAVLLLSQSGRRRELVERWLISGEGTPIDAGYELTLRRDRDIEGDLGEIRVDGNRRVVTASTGWLQLETLTEFLPADACEQLSPLGARGRARVAKAEFGFPADALPTTARDALRTLEIEWRDVAAAIPWEDGWPRVVEPLTPPAARYGQVRGVDGQLRWVGRRPGEPPELVLNVTGALRDAKFNVRALSHDVAALSLPTPARRGAGGIFETLEIDIDGLDLPTLEQQEKYLARGVLQGPLADFVRKYEPGGRLSVKLHLAPPAERPDPADEERSPWRGEITVHDGRCRFQKFPYQFEHVAGKLALWDGRTNVVGLTARRGAARVAMTGVVNDTSRWSAFDLDIRAADVPLNEELYEALPKEFRGLWARAAPLGLADVTVRIARPKGTPEHGPVDPVADIRATVAGGSVFTGTERLHAIDAWVEIGDGAVTIRDLYGQSRGALRVAGRLPSRLGPDPAPPGSPDPSAASQRAGLTVRAYDVPLSVVPDAGAAPGGFLFDGVADLRTRWRPDAQGSAEISERVDLRLKNGVAQAATGRMSWEIVKGLVSRTPQQLMLRNLEARAAGAAAFITGVVGTPPTSAHPLDLDLLIHADDLQTTLNDLLPVRNRDWLHQLGLAGRGGVRVHLRDTSSANSSMPGNVELEVDAAALQPRLLPLPLRNLRACLSMQGPFFEIGQCELQMEDDTPVRLRATGAWTDGGPALRGAVEVRGLELEPSVVRALPEAMQGVLHALAPEGSYDITVDELRTDASGAWFVRGRVTSPNAAMQAGLPLTGASVSMLAEGAVDPMGRLSLQGTFRVDAGRLNDLPIDRWSGRFRVRPEDPLIVFDEIRGRWCGGQILATARFNYETQEYEASAEVSGAQLADVLRKPAGKGMTGSVSGRLEVRGVANDLASRRGTGAFALRGVPFRGTPVLEPVAKSAPPADGPLKGTPADIDLDVEIHGTRARLARVDLSSEDLRLIGAGSYSLGTGRLDLRLFGAHPRHAPRILGITELLETANRGLVQFRVSGTLDSPKVDVTPLPALNDAIQALLGDG
jgi:hypothetical protein